MQIGLQFLNLTTKTIVQPLKAILVGKYVYINYCNYGHIKSTKCFYHLSYAIFTANMMELVITLSSLTACGIKEYLKKSRVRLPFTKDRYLPEQRR